MLAGQNIRWHYHFLTLTLHINGHWVQYIHGPCSPSSVQWAVVHNIKYKYNSVSLILDCPKTVTLQILFVKTWEILVSILPPAVFATRPLTASRNHTGIQGICSVVVGWAGNTRDVSLPALLTSIYGITWRSSHRSACRSCPLWPDRALFHLSHVLPSPLQ